MNFVDGSCKLAGVAGESTSWKKFWDKNYWWDIDFVTRENETEKNDEQ